MSFSQDSADPVGVADHAHNLVAEMNMRPGHDDYLTYWAGHARELINWQQDFRQVLDWEPPYAEWFVGGKLNVSQNCLDRHVESGNGERIALYWVGEQGETRQISYGELSEEVRRLANALKVLGVERGDRVAIYLPRVPELLASMLACARIGAVHTVVFAGLSSDALAERLNDATVTALVTANGGWLDGRHVAFKDLCDEALETAPSVQTVLVVDRDGGAADMAEGRDFWYHECVSEASPDCRAEEINSEELLYLLYTSGVTDRPKGIMHTSGGYVTQVATTMTDVFSMDPERDVFWCGVDPAWAAGHSYGVYGPLLCGVSSLLYEGAMSASNHGRMPKLLAEYSVSHIYVTPDTVGAWMQTDSAQANRMDLPSLKQVVAFGDALRPEAGDWLQEQSGGLSVPVTNTWWQSESGAIMAAGSVGSDASMAPVPGISLDVVDGLGQSLGDTAGILASTRPWPAMLRGVWDQPKHYRSDYWALESGYFNSGDYASMDPSGRIRLLGRVEDLVATAGGLVSPAEMEGLLHQLPTVSESVIVSVPRKGRSDPVLVAFVTVQSGVEASDELGGRLADHLENELGEHARPTAVAFAQQLPRTDDGKLMRRLLRDVVAGRDHGDISTLLDPTLMEEVRVRASYPENWCWRNGPIDPGPVVIVDIDGTIADANERMKGIEGNRENWLDFMVGAGNDALIVEVARLIELLTKDVAIVMLSARPISILDETRDWLDRHEVRWDLMILRGTTSIDPPRHFKRHRALELREYNLDPVLALEDDPRNVEMYRSEGVPCLYLHSGIHT